MLQVGVKEGKKGNRSRMARPSAFQGQVEPAVWGTEQDKGQHVGEACDMWL